MEPTLLGFKNGTKFYLSTNKESSRILKYIDGKWQMWNDKILIDCLSDIKESQCEKIDNNLSIRYGYGLSVSDTYISIIRKYNMYYKVLTNTMESIASKYTHTPSYSHKVRYSLNTWTFPTKLGSGLFVFNTLEAAEQAIEENDWDNGGCQIFECECHGEISKDTLDVDAWKPSHINSDIMKNSSIFLGVKLIKKVVKEDKILREGDKFIWTSVGDSNVVLAQSSKNKFMVFQSCDMNSITTDTIDGENFTHGVSWSRLEEFAKNHNATIRKE